MSKNVRLVSPDRTPAERAAAGFLRGRRHAGDEHAMTPGDTEEQILRPLFASESDAADRHKDEFLAILAHELRNPLAAVRAAATLLSTPGVAAAVAEKARGVIDRQVQTLTRLTDDLFDVARITQGKLSVRMTQVDLTVVLSRAIEVVDYQVRQRGQQLILSLPAEPWFVRGDATRLEQVFGNLLVNASKFSRTGGRVWLSTEKRPARPGAGELRVRIRDEGSGIAADQLPYIFDLFRQAGPSPHHASGLGVGLALVRRIVELHGGDVRVQTGGADRGTEFVVSLPLADPDDDSS
jgi:signal transduction histidine kinase